MVNGLNLYVGKGCNCQRIGHTQWCCKTPKSEVCPGTNSDEDIFLGAVHDSNMPQFFGKHNTVIIDHGMNSYCDLDEKTADRTTCTHYIHVFAVPIN